MEDVYEKAAANIAKGEIVIAVTGAGASVESGVPDFRSAGGLWSKYPPNKYATIEAFIENPDKVWQLWYDLREMLGNVKPNAGHEALAQLERAGRLHAIITQNIDNLHEEAGSTKVIEYHGNASWMTCLGCERRRPLDLSQRTPGAPRCMCGDVMKPDVVFFGEMIPVKAMQESEMLAHTCDVVIIVGTSATVYPAAALPHTAKRNGAYIIECNIEETDFTHTITDAFLQGPAGETLPKLLRVLEAQV